MSWKCLIPVLQAQLEVSPEEVRQALMEALLVLSQESDNTLEIKSDGLFAAGADVVLSGEPGNTLEVKPDGLYAPEANVEISSDPDNIIENRPDGLYATGGMPPATVNDAGKVLIVDLNGTPHWVEPSANLEGLAGQPLGSLI